MDRRIRVLVVEDEAVTRRAIARLLQAGDLQPEVEQCDNGPAAVQQLNGGGFDCIFLDHFLPGKDGLSILQEARSSGIRTPIVILTGAGDELLAVEAMKAGATDYLPKSRMSPEVLGQTLRYALRVREMETREEAAREQLRASEERLARIVETITDGVLLLDCSGRYTFANVAAERILGVLAEQIVQRTYREPLWTRTRLDGSPFPADEHPFIQVMETGRAVAGLEVGTTRADGKQLSISLSAAPLRDRAGNIEGVVATLHDVTEQRWAIKSLRESEKRFSTVFYASPIPLLVTTLEEGRILDANESFLALSGYARDELIGRTTVGIGGWLGAEERSQIRELLLRNSPTHQYEKQFRNKTGRLFDAIASMERIELDGRPCIITMLVDITERKRAEAALRESEERYRRLVETANEGIWALDAQNRTTFVNRKMAEMLGYSVEEMIGKLGTDFVSEQTRAEARRQLDRRRRGISEQFENQYVHKDGRIIWALLSGSPIMDGDGRHVGSFGMITDITERKRMEEALRDSNARLAAVIQASPLAICSLDHQGLVRTWNPAAERIFGWREAEVLGRPLPIVPPEKADEHQEVNRIALSGQMLTGMELKRRRKDGTLLDISLWAAPLRDAQGQTVGIIGIIEDITEAKQMKEQLLAAHRMETVGRLAGGVAHDFNNLLAVISGYSESLLRRMPPEGPLRAQVEEIQKAADRGATLTRQLLAFSRRQVIQPQVLDLNHVVGSVCQMLRSVIGDAIQVVVRTQNRPALVKGDPGQMEQVLVNLALNARDAMPAGGRLSISTSELQLGNRAAAGHDLPAGAYIRLRVQDTGVGMDDELQSRAFEPFFTTKEGKGTGLGLSIVYGIVQQCGGRISVTSQPGKGSTFNILLPAAPPPPAESPSA